MKLAVSSSLSMAPRMCGWPMSAWHATLFEIGYSMRNGVPLEMRIEIT
jgi:hypothetical protein